MKKLLFILAGGALAACSRQGSAEVALTHAHDQAYQQQVKLLQADEVTLGERSVGQGNAAFRVLTLTVLNPKNQPTQPDTLRQRVRKLARLVVADLRTPAVYKTVNVEVTFKPGWFARAGAVDNSQTLIFPLASLQ